MSSGLLKLSGRLYAILFSIFMLAPMIVVLTVSFTNEGYVSFPPQSFGLRWYAEVFASDTFMNAMRYSLIVAAVTAASSGLLGVAAAVALADREMKGRGTLLMIATMPLTLPHIVLAIALLQLFGMFAVPTAPYALLIGHILITAPYVLRLTLASLSGLDPKLALASYSLGASRLYTLTRIIVPLGMRGVMAGLLFAFLLSFDEVTISLFTALPGAMTLPAEIFSYASQGSDPIIAAASGIMIIVSALGVVGIELSFGLLRIIAGEDRSRRK